MEQLSTLPKEFSLLRRQLVFRSERGAIHEVSSWMQ